MPHDNFIAEGFNTQTHSDGVHIRFIFLNAADEDRTVIIRRQHLPQMMAALQKEIEPGKSLAPIRPQNLQFGTDYKMAGYEVRKHPDGGANLTLAVELLGQGRTVTLGLKMSPTETVALIKHLGGSVT